MPYEYGYELSSCDICGSSLYLPGEGCSNCNGIAKPISEAELARKAESAALYEDKLKKAELLREEIRRKNTLSLQRYANFKELRDSVLLDYQDKVSNLSERQQKVISGRASAFQKNNQTLQARIFSKLQQICALNLMSYSDERASILATMLAEAERELLDLKSEAKAELDFIERKKSATSEPFLSKTPHDNGFFKRTTVQSSRVDFVQTEKPVTTQIPQAVKSEKVRPMQSVAPSESKTAIIYLYIEGERNVVEQAVQSAHQKGLTPQFVLFSKSKPNALWKARIRREDVSASIFEELTKVGWV